MEEPLPSVSAEEFLAICTRGQLGLHEKPYGVLNASGFYDPLFALLDHLAAKKFLLPGQTAMIQRSADPADFLAKLARFKPAYIPKWIDTSVGGK